MSHQDSYRKNEAYAKFLSEWDSAFYRKYCDRLQPLQPGGRVLDAGCGVGQVVGALQAAGFEAHGVDVSEPNIARAKKVCPRCQFYDGKRLPFADGFFAAVGALNVLEHVEEPEAFISELVRVTDHGGKIILSSPNFFRVLGFRDYHPHMRGVGNKLRNWQRLREKRSQMHRAPDQVRFDRMTPIVKEPFTPDDDAIVATNAVEMAFFLKRSGCEILSVECTDRYVAKLADALVNAGSWRYLMFNAFVVARKL
jgi:2-polyprenyl-3-methyl-5-hydroxy-6-metoxy-1,4-benzoquinol methylase